MKRMTCKLSILLLIGPFTFSPLIAGEVWTLDKAIEVALENSPDARIAMGRVEGAEALLQEARSMGMPNLTLSSGYTQTNSPMLAFGSILNQHAFDFGLDFNSPGTIDNFNATATAGINLYSGNRVSSAKRAAQAGLNAAGYDDWSVRQKLISETVKAYLNIRKAKEAVAAVEAGVKAYESAVSNAELRFEAGQLLKADFLSLEVQLARTRESLMETQHHYRLSKRVFVFVLGLPVSEEDIEVLESDPSIARIVEPVELDYSDRSELKALRERENAAAEMVKVARGGKKPSVMGFASYQYDKGWETGRNGDAWLAGLAVKLDLFDGGATPARIKKAEIQLAELREIIRKTDLGIGLEVEQARLALALARDRVAVTELSVNQAEESASLSRSRYEEGLLLTAELIGVEGRLMEARMRRAIATADEVIATADLRRAVGVHPVEN